MITVVKELQLVVEVKIETFSLECDSTKKLLKNSILIKKTFLRSNKWLVSNLYMYICKHGSTYFYLILLFVSSSFLANNVITCCNAIKKDLNGWINNSFFLWKRQKNQCVGLYVLKRIEKCASLYVLLMLKIVTNFGDFLNLF